MIDNVRLQADSYRIQGNYSEATIAYEQAIADDPSNATLYWYLGLALLLQGEEAEAQLTWMTPLMEAEPEQAEQWTAELLQVLQAEADRQEANESYESAWLLHQHMREFRLEAGNERATLLKALASGLKAGAIGLDNALVEEAITVLTSTEPTSEAVPLETLRSIISLLLKSDDEHPKAYEFLSACEPHFTAQGQLIELIRGLMEIADRSHKISHYATAIQLAKFCLKMAPEDVRVVSKAVFFMQSGNAVDLLESLPLAKWLLQSASNIIEEVTVTQYILTSLIMNCQPWQDTYEYYEKHKALLQSIKIPDTLKIKNIHHTMAMGMILNYFEDNPSVNRPIRNQIAAVSQAELQTYHVDRVNRYSQRHLIRRTETKPLKIGYLSDCLRLHSVGWLCRWLLQHHDRQRFDIHLYSTRQSNDQIQQAFIRAYGDRFHLVPFSAGEIADQIHQDGIDILVELDSITAFGSCAVTSLKPAPIQVSWLGYDASGLPAIDYYLADPYVLPASAQDYYAEKIWRLPHTYIAVDGFEVGTPSLRRDQLGIPSEAIVYLNSQTGLKANPDNIRLQMQILKAVPNSHFLVKNFQIDHALLAEFFHQFADDAGVERDRIHFSPYVVANETHRANLGLADIVLDTYPYNGATTTLEALWMELPIVTRVGEQFAARNSYTMMINAGITEGIAWSDDEYIEWGIRLGQDTALRGNIAHRLRQSRQTAPLWNTPAFAQQIEQAYTQMWKIYQDAM
ncbi:MAG: tetratricopeptide repeat protein [Drouetiella hepatica Uher 2000/2452]|jgi:predicted O-linked N-acetylglucosamine transferase (SPINDLY family)|uniref:protein O-GlcNAc transferase n=1 Tax=Drouetiella hepatica Uher 2000/2452 TaxID=904376 RepID=A0A951QDI5_9CYAN|nr:tetratricopeptide repeat protein [Drouetiella hepatica Uher 2000/2452]